MNGPRFRLVQGKALGERSTPPVVAPEPAPQTPQASQVKQELEYVPEDPNLENINVKKEETMSPPMNMGGTPQMMQRPSMQGPMQYQQQPQGIQPPSIPQPNQSSEDKNVQKCVRFLKTLISLSQNDDPDMPDKAARVKTLIQGVVYMENTAEEFTRDLQQVLRSQAQPHLLPFLQNTLPALRNAVRNGTASVEGVHPPVGYVFNNSRVNHQMAPQPPQATPQQHQMMPPPQGSQQIINRLNNGPDMMNRNQMIPPQHRPISQGQGPLIQGQQGQIPIQRTMSGQQPQMQHQMPPQIPSQNMNIQQQNPQITAQLAPPPPQQMPPQQAPPATQPMEIDQPPPAPQEAPPRTRQYAEGSLKSSILKPDEVLNRITKRMMASCSVEEEALVAISDAVESHLREMITMMAGIAEHRVESMRVPDNYQAVDDVKRQLRFLEDVDRQEEEQRESREKESLIRMSKNKNSGKETIEKAKEMQRADAEAKRNRDANAAAIAALSSNRTVKNKWEGGASSATAPRPRTVRVTTRDLHLVANTDRRFIGTFIREKLSYGGPAVDTTI